ncbi:MAG: hypothetical protein RBT34_15375, partial [Anaerolineaceae bacterium]|nr:hypothetical protein [Anaerolineaceae bacterium]
MGSKNLSAIMRPVDWNYPTNRLIILLSLGVLVLGTMYQLVWAGLGFLSALGWGASTGLAVFVCWALSRELDPDDEYAAFVAVGLYLAGILIWEAQGRLLVMFWLIETIRILNRSVGLPVKIMDGVLLLGLMGWLLWQGYYEVGLLTAAAFFVDDRLSAENRQELVLGGISVVMTVVVFLLRPQPLIVNPAGAPVAVLAVMAVSIILYIWLILKSSRPIAVCDVGGSPLRGACVQAGQ